MPLRILPANPLLRMRATAELQRVSEATQRSPLHVALEARLNWLSYDGRKLFDSTGSIASRLLDAYEGAAVSRAEAALWVLVLVWLSARVSTYVDPSEAVGARLNKALKRATSVLDPDTLETSALFTSVQVAVAMLEGIEPRDPIPDAPAWLLAAWLIGSRRRRRSTEGSSAPDSTRSLGAVLNDLEGAVFGGAHEKADRWWRGLAAPGQSTREVAAYYLHGHRSAKLDVAHIFANLHLQSDTFPAWLGTLAAITGADLVRHAPSAKRQTTNAIDVLRRQRHIDSVLRASAMYGRPDCDGFRVNGRQLGELSLSIGDPFAWLLAGTTAPRGQGASGPHTAAFDAIRHRQALARFSANTLAEMRNDVANEPRLAPAITRLIRPQTDLESMTSELRQLAPGFGYIGVFAEPLATLGWVAAWNTGTGVRTSTATSSMAETAVPLQHLLSPTSTAANRTKAYSALIDALRRPLGELLGQAMSARPLAWGVLAPGPLRSLPWLGLRAGDRQLLDCIGSLIHLPSIAHHADFAARPARATASLLAAAPAEGSMESTAKVELALRAWRPVTVTLESAPARGSDIGEVDILERAAGNLGLLRVCGVGVPQALASISAGVQLDRRRQLGGFNFIDTSFAPGARVELWSDHGCLDDHQLACGFGRDRHPGLIGPLLASGAASVLDIAWPISDLVKALVLEQYSWRSGQSAAQLVTAVRAVRELASALQSAVALPRSARRGDVLSHLRAESALGLGVPALGVAKLEAEAAAVDELLDADALDVSLGAFRWWGYDEQIP